MTELVLGGEFPTPTTEQWQGLVAKIVARSGVEGDAIEALTSHTADGIAIAPLYTASTDIPPTGLPGAFPFTRGRTTDGLRAGWDVRAHFADPDPTSLSEAALVDLDGGVTSLWLQVGPGATAVGELPAALRGVMLDLAGVCLDAGPEAVPAAEAYLALAAQSGVDAKTLTGCLGLDPWGTAARTGHHADIASDARAAGELARRVADEYPGLRALVVDALPYHDAGASNAQEIGLALAGGVAALRALTEAGLDVASALNSLEFRLSATADQFATVAKLRAARRAWAAVAAECGERGPAAGMRQHAVTSWPMVTRHDPWNNMLRTTLACFGACVGGADVITVRPFDAALGRPDALARRIARNTPALLLEESHIGAVLDPVGGSWLHEALSEQLAAAAWAVFTEIEAAGGLAAGLADGSVAARIATSRALRTAALADGTESIVGVTVFPLADEKLLDRPAAPEPPGGGLPRIRWEQEFESEVNQ
ncbi:MAG TPA: methylmalonyl-CoA mutase family protein [Sporichthyaceae bacterium]|nr:methylmalonyl-CoA mutase family protein [Sporichthyaceae bacterium]